MSNSFSGQNIKGRLDNVVSSDSFSRPANTTAYAIDDAISDNATAGSATNLELGSLAISNGGFLRLDFVNLTSTNAVAAPDIDLWLFSAAPSAQGDNTAFTLTDSEINDTCVIPLVAGTDSFVTDSNWALQVRNINTIIKIPDNTTTLYAQLQIKSVYTPASGETFNLKVIGTLI